MMRPLGGAVETGRSTRAPIAPIVQVRLPLAPGQRRWRLLAAFLITLGGLLLVDALTWGDWWSSFLWVPVGLVAGFVARRGRLLWMGWLAVAAYFPISRLGESRDFGPFWYLGAILGGCLVAIGFAAGSTLERRSNPWTDARVVWHGIGRRWRRLINGGVAVALIGFGAYTGYIGAAGSGAIVHPRATRAGCDTPKTRFGWMFEAINYDPTDDARLTASNPDRLHCSSQGTTAGTEVVTSDGVPIAGWYIPAANGIGPTGPTVLIVHGWKSNKSQVLKYAPPFHDAYNLVLIDLRNGGRSGPADTTMGFREQLDVRAMIDWLERVKHPTWIAAVGNSMGGATVLAEAVSDPRVRALVIDSTHAHAVVSFGDGLEVENGHPSLPGSWAIVAGMALRLGADWTVVDPVRTIAQLGDRPVLLTHGTNDVIDRPAESADLNYRAARDARVPVELRYCHGATHGAVVDTCPVEWARWVTSFLEEARARL